MRSMRSMAIATSRRTEETTGTPQTGTIKDIYWFQLNAAAGPEALDNSLDLNEEVMEEFLYLL
jgi:hypothetical protein